MTITYEASYCLDHFKSVIMTTEYFVNLDSFCYDSSYAPSLIAMLMTMLMTILRAIVDRSPLEHRLVPKSILFRISLCSSESYR